MDIGLYTGAISLATRRTDGSGPAQEPGGLTPIPGILDAPNIVVLGASIMDSGFGADDTLNDGIADYAQAAGFTGVLHTRSKAGETIGLTDLRHAAVAAEPAIATSAGQNVYVLHTGGNNVTSNRPWPGGQADFSDDYAALMQQITANGDKVIPLPLTKRLYTGAPQVIHGDAASEAFGPRPYNENIIHPAIGQYAPLWRNGTDAPFVNPYELADRYPQLLNSDGVHGYGESIARYILARVAARAKGLDGSESRAGTAILYSTEKNNPNGMSVGPINQFKSFGGGVFQNHPLLCGAVTTAGAFDPFITALTNDVFQNASLNAGTGTYARIADTRFHDPQIVNNGIYVAGTKKYDLTFENLTPGDTVIVSAVGVRNASGTNRRGRVSLSDGQELVLDAANNAASNQITFAPTPVPADGRLTLSLSVLPGSTYGYLHGVLLEFS